MKPLLIKHLEGESIGRFPVWMMRQAGRYLPEYQTIRQKHTFWEMVTEPELASQISLLPLNALPVDGIILFSDILSLPYGLGVKIEMKDRIGPVNLNPFFKVEDFALFDQFSFDKHTSFVGNALEEISKKLPEEIALLGFAGAPWTVACYLAESQSGKKRFEGIRHWLYQDPEGLASGMKLLAKATTQYLEGQFHHGAHLVQLFDTWLSEMPQWFFRDFYCSILVQIISDLRKRGNKVIYFSKQSHHLLDDFSDLPMDVLSVDSLVSLGEVERRTGARFSLQGNLDPTLLLGDERIVRKETRLLVHEARKLSHPAIINLGHGIFPETPVSNVRAFVEEAREEWI